MSYKTDNIVNQNINLSLDWFSFDWNETKPYKNAFPLIIQVEGAIKSKKWSWSQISSSGRGLSFWTAAKAALVVLFGLFDIFLLPRRSIPDR